MSGGSGLTLVMLTYAYLGYSTYKFLKAIPKRTGSTDLNPEKPNPKESKLLLKWIMCTFLLLFESWIDLFFFWVPGLYTVKTCGFVLLLVDNSMAAKLYRRVGWVITLFEGALDFMMKYVYVVGTKAGLPLVLVFLANSRCIIYGSTKK
jgi:hypothetical protein